MVARMRSPGERGFSPGSRDEPSSFEKSSGDSSTLLSFMRFDGGWKGVDVTNGCQASVSYKRDLSLCQLSMCDLFFQNLDWGRTKTISRFSP